MEADRRLSPSLGCRRSDAGGSLSPRVACGRWMVQYDGGRKSCTAGVDSAYRRLRQRLSRSVIQQQTVEQTVGFPVATVVDSVPQMMVPLAKVPQTVPRDRIQQRADERMDDFPVLKVPEELVEKDIVDRIVVQIADVTDCPADPGRIGEQIIDASGSQHREEAVEVMRLTPHEPVQNLCVIVPPKVVQMRVVLKTVSRDGIQHRIKVLDSSSQDRTLQHTVERFFSIFL